MQGILIPFMVLGTVSAVTGQGCQFYPLGEYLRFVRVPESLPVGDEVLLVEVHPRKNLTIQAVDAKEDAHFFRYKTVNRTHISLRLAQSLENLVDNPVPQNVLKFRLVCDYQEGDDTINNYLSATVYVEDVNDHGPVFVDAPYHVNVDELTPTGLTVFRGIQAVDMDKPNTPNSEIVYSLTGGNTGSKFSLEMQGHRPALVLKKPLDYDTGDTDFKLIVTASDRGTPPWSSTATVSITVNDSDDLSPRFTKDVYRTQVVESHPITGKKQHKPLFFNPRIEAFDQDSAINATVRYDIVTGNDHQAFSMDPQNGTIFLDREIDLDTLRGNIFTLQIQATQLDNPLKTGVSRVEVEILDLNDNQPQFEVEMYNISIVENLPNGFSVLQVIATDIDQGDNGEFVYHLVDPSQAFSVDSRTGWLTVRNQAKLDREVRPQLNMRVLAREKMPSVVNPNVESFVNVEVTLLDANDNNPTFTPSNLYEFTISNVAPVGHLIGKVEAVDPDLGRNGMVLYEMKRGNKTSHAVPFIVSPKTGEIRVADSPIPVGRKALFVEASDQPANPSERRFSLAVVTVDVIVSDKINVPPDFIGAPYEFWVGDDVAIGTSVGQVRVTEAVDKSRAVYDLLHSYHDGVPFAIEERSGVITVVDDISKYDNNLYDFEAVVTDERKVNLVTNVTLHIVESSVSNDEKLSLLEFKVRENLSGAMVGRIVVGPGKDVVKGKPLKFSIADQQDSALFAVSQDGTLYTQKSLDREHRDSYFITVVVTTGRGDRYYQAHVHVEDENDNPPMFEKSLYEGHVREDCRGECEVKLDHRIRAVDPDKGAHSEFTVTLQGDGSELFAISPQGKILVKAPIDRETKDIYPLVLVARDKGNLSSQVKLTIHIDDVNDNKPVFVQMLVPFEKGVKVVPGTRSSLQIVLGNETVPYPKAFNRKKEFPTLIIPETMQIGMMLFKLLATDKDVGENSTLTYNIASETYIPKAPFTKVYMTHHYAIHPITGEVTVASVLPPESEFLVNFTAIDGGGLLDSIVVRIKVEDVNDNAPVFEKPRYEFSIPEGTYEESYVGRVVAKDADFGDNGNVTYSVFHKQNTTSLPFTVTPEGRVLVTADLDRESKDFYSFKVLAHDNGPIDTRQRTTGDVFIHVTDVNDNAPVFYGFDRVVQSTPAALGVSENAPEGYERSLLVPVYFASVAENSAPGIPIARIKANDSDLSDSGNGIILFDILRKQNHRQLFAIDKEGVVTVTTYLDFETQPSHNVTIIASDLGTPSLSSTALLIVTVVDVVETTTAALPSKPMLPVNYYELEVYENCQVPIELMKVNTSRDDQDVRFSLTPGPPDSDYFRVDPKNGSLFLVISPDRESVAELQAKVKVVLSKRSRNLAHVIYPVYPSDIGNKIRDKARIISTANNASEASIQITKLFVVVDYDVLITTIAGSIRWGEPSITGSMKNTCQVVGGEDDNEVKIVVKIRDVNDNVPKFSTSGRPYVAAVPTTASYGYPIIKLHATDDDEGLNGEIRYQMLLRDESEAAKFTVDPVTGQIKALMSFQDEAGRVYGFDVKATDKAGSDEGHSSIANVFVYVLDEQKKLVMVMGAKPIDIENNINNITAALSNVTGLDVRVRKLEPHFSKEATDMYLYAVDPHMNVIVDADTFSHVLKTSPNEVKRAIEPYHMLSIVSPEPDEGFVKKKQSQSYINLSGLELATIALGCIVFLGAVTSAFCVICLHKRRKKKDVFGHNMGVAPLSADLMFHSKEHIEAKPRSLFHPNAFVEESTDSYVSNRSDCGRSARSHRSGYRTTRRHRHLANCPRHHHSRTSRRMSTSERPSSAQLVKTSMASVHSSGRDSGIVEPHHGCCPCGHSSSHSSANSSHEDPQRNLSTFEPQNTFESGSYEDSLKSLHRAHSHSSGSPGCGGGHPSLGGRRRSTRSIADLGQHYPPPVPPPISRRPSGRMLIS